MKNYLPLTAAAGLFLLLIVCAPEAAEGARHGLSVCAGTLIPSLFPFFVLSSLLSDLGLSRLLTKSLGTFTKKLFHLSGAGAQAFLLGLCGGYPLGAVITADLRKKGLISRDEAERLLAFCNNSGPAFILGAAGGVFGSVSIGLLLYVSHIMAAVCVGLLFRPKTASDIPVPDVPPHPLPEAVPAAVSKSVASLLSVCGYVVLFSALLGVFTAHFMLPPLCQSFLTGLVELGSGIASFRGLSPAPEVLALCAFLLGFGGLSVHFQTISAVAGTDIKCTRHLTGRVLCGLIAAVFSYVAGIFAV